MRVSLYCLFNELAKRLGLYFAEGFARMIVKGVVWGSVVKGVVRGKLFPFVSLFAQINLLLLESLISHINSFKDSCSLEPQNFFFFKALYCYSLLFFKIYLLTSHIFCLKGVFIARGKEDALVTKNMVAGESVYGEKKISVDVEGGEKIEYRVWNPFRSKLAAAILGGVDQIHMKPGSKVLYLGAASGTTVSHVSDIVGPVSIFLYLTFY